MTVAKTPSFIEIHSAHNRKVVCYYREKHYENHELSLFFISNQIRICCKINRSCSTASRKNITYLKLEATYNRPRVKKSSDNRAFKTWAREVFAENRSVLSTKILFKLFKGGENDIGKETSISFKRRVQLRFGADLSWGHYAEGESIAAFPNRG